MNPPHGPPTPETQPHAPVALLLASASQVPPEGQVLPQVPAWSMPHGSTHAVPGPAQQAGPPAGVRQMHACSHVPSTQWSTVHPLPSSQSVSVVHPGTHWQLGAPVGLWHVLPVGQVPLQAGDESPHAGGVFGMQAQVSPVAVQTSSAAGQTPPQVPSALVPQGVRQSESGPGQQAAPPAGVRHTQACWQLPFTHESAVHALPSLQSASVVHSGGGHCGSQTSFGFRHGMPGPHGSVLHCRSTVTKQCPFGGGGGHVVSQNWFGRHGWSGPHDSAVHLRVVRSKQVPVGGVVPQVGEQNSFGSRQPAAGEQLAPVHWCSMVSKQPPLAKQAPACSLHAPACCRRQSLALVVPSQPQTGATMSGQTWGCGRQTPPVLVQLAPRHSQNAPGPQSLSALHGWQAAAVGRGQTCATSRRTLSAQLPESCFPRRLVRKSEVTHAA